MEDRTNGVDINSKVDGSQSSEAAAQDAEAQDVSAFEDAASDIEQLKADLDAARDRFLRQAAEFQNYKRRTEQEKATLVDIGKGAVILPMLGVLDDLSRSVEAVAQGETHENIEASYRSLKEGIELVHRKFVEELTRLGVQPIEAVGKPFNEAEHEALMQQPAPEGTAPGTVLAEFERGYRLGDRVLRHSKVVVAA